MINISAKVLLLSVIAGCIFTFDAQHTSYISNTKVNNLPAATATASPISPFLAADGVVFAQLPHDYQLIPVSFSQAINPFAGLRLNVDLTRHDAGGFAIDWANQYAYTIERTNLAGPDGIGKLAQVFQIELATGRKKQIYEDLDLAGLVLTPDSRYLLVFYIGDWRAATLLYCILDLTTGTCQKVPPALLLPDQIAWVDNRRFMAKLAGIFYKGTVTSNGIDGGRFTGLDDSWMPTALDVIPGTHTILIAARSYKIDVYATIGNFVKFDMDTSQSTPLPFEIETKGVGYPQLIRVSPDGQYLMSCSTICSLMDLMTGKVLAQTSNVSAVKWLPDSKGILVMQSTDTATKVSRLDVSTGKLQYVTQFPGGGLYLR